MDGIYTFAGFRLDATERSFSSGDQPVTLPPKVFDTLRHLVENAGRVLSKEKMMAEVWEGSFVEENNLAQNISQLRRVIGAELIETVPKFGYRFVGEVTTDGDGEVSTEIFESSHGRIYIDDHAGSAASPRLTIPASTQLPRAKYDVRYAQNGDVNIAYQVVGDGPVDIVFVMGWVSHLEYFWEEPRFTAFLNRLASFSRLIIFDKRGTGLSDRVPLEYLPNLEQRMEDVHAVMDAVGSKRAVLVGVSEGGPMCSLFAATYPERTSALVMIGTYAKRIRDDEYPWAPTEEQREAFFELMRREWGGPVGIDERAPSLAGDSAFREWWATYLRMGASPGAAVALTKMNAEIDVRAVLPIIHVPTLVIHRSGDMCLKVEEGRFVASQISGAKFVELDGIDHLPFVGEQEEILDEIERFVTETQFAADHDRVLATVISVRSKGAENDLVRTQLHDFKGREIFNDDGEMIAAFDGPARAIRCAMAINEIATRENVGLEIGLHTGECDVVDDKYSGVAVELARHVRSVSTKGNIIVSRTVKDLVAGSGLKFEDLGTRTFDGVDGEWRLFSVMQ